MAVSAIQAAKKICERSGWSLSNLSIQKILYLANMIHIGRYGRPLVNESFEAWAYGPVQPGLYHRLKVFGSDSVGNIFRRVPDIQDDETERFLREAVNGLSDVSPSKLVALTHSEECAWSWHYKPGQKHIAIPRNDIAKEYRVRFDE